MANGQTFLACVLQLSHPSLDPLPVRIRAGTLRQKWMTMLLRALPFLGFFLSVVPPPLWFFFGFLCVWFLIS